MALKTTNLERCEVFAGTALVAGPITVAAYNALVDAGVVVAMGDASGSAHRYRGLDAEVAGTAAEDTELVIKVWAVHRVDGSDSTAPDCYRLRLIGTLDAVLGATTGLAGTEVPATYRFADEMDWTTSAYGTMARLKGSAQHITCEPGGGAPAILSLGDVNNAVGVIFECTGATACVVAEVGT